MESITAIVAAGAAFALSYYLGRFAASSAPVAAMMGAVCGLAFAVLFFVTTVVLGALHPGLFDGWTLGIHFLAGGHYATETFGVKALAARLADEFSLGWEFLDVENPI